MWLRVLAVGLMYFALAAPVTGETHPDQGAITKSEGIDVSDRFRSSMDDEFEFRRAAEPGRQEVRAGAALSVPEDAYWSNEFHALNVLYGTGTPYIWTMLEWNDELIVGGTIKSIGGVAVEYIASWDGNSVQPLGWGLSSVGASNANALVEYEGDLIVGGYFERAGNNIGTNCIARWDGTSWSTFASGFTHTIQAGAAGPAPVTDLAVYGGQLVASGHMEVPGTGIGGVMVWDGAAWQAFAGGADSTVNVIYEDGNKLYVGGRFLNIGGNPIAHFACWDGSAWSAVGGDPGSPVTAITRHGTDLIIGGSGFVNATGGGGTCFVAKWDGSNWVSMDNGITSTPDELCSYNGSLFSGSAVRRWDGNQWTILTGTGSTEIWCIGKALTEYSNKLLIGGRFGIYDGLYSENVTTVMYWDGNDFQPFGQGLWRVQDDYGAFANAFCEYDGKLIVGGYNDFAGTTMMTSIAAWDGTTWSNPFGSPDGSVWCMTEYDGKLIAGGPFATIGSLSASRIASWDGTEWSGLGDGLPSTTATEAPYDLVEFQGDLYACGFFLGYLSRWDGSTWAPVEAGPGPNDACYGMAVYDDKLFVFGRYVFVGSVFTSPNVAAWDGTTWVDIGGGTNDRAYCGVVYDGDLYVGGRFTSAGGVPCQGLARWDGTQWHAVDQPVANGAVRHMALLDNNINYILFENVDPFPYHIGGYDGANHFSLGSGFSPSDGGLTALYSWNGRLWVGTNNVLTAGEKSVSGMTSWAPDADQDGILGLVDNCPMAANPLQEDADGDDVGDECDQCPGFNDLVDSDGDEVADGCDACPGFADHLDFDKDGKADGCDNCRFAANADQADPDEDGIGSACDNCPDDANPDQADSDGDGFGNVCDGCCVGRVGDANGQGDYPDEVTLSDIMVMVDMLFISENEVACMAEADINHSGGYQPVKENVTLSDIMTLVDFLFITGPETATLPECL